MRNDMRCCRASLWAVLVITGMSLCVQAQSGRRVPKQPRVPVPEPVIVDVTPPSAPAAERKKPETTVRLYSNIYETGLRGLVRPERIHSWAVERLRRGLTLETLDGGSANRSKAIKQAKSEEGGAYVVLLDLQSDMFGSRGGGRGYSIEVMIYSPISGKLKASRRIDIGQGRSRTQNILLNCYPELYGDDLLMLEASVEAADFVFGAFYMPIPSLCARRGI